MNRTGSVSFPYRRVSARPVPEPLDAGQLSFDNRREFRRPANGPVTVRFGYGRAFEVQGRLVDISDGGFRMAHQCTTLETGQTVEFSHTEASGNARVIWNKIVDQIVETGFFVVKA